MASYYLTDLRLVDNQPGAVNPHVGVPANGFDNTTDNFQTTSATQGPSYPLGTKVMAYSDATAAPGWYTMQYLAYHSYETGALYDVSGDFSDGQFWCTHADGSTAAFYGETFSQVPWYVMSKCITKGAGDVSTYGAMAVPCATLASDGTACFSQGGYGDSFGWFWVGGVCPVDDVTIFRGLADSAKGADVTGDFPTKAKGPVFLEWSAALSTVMLTCDQTSQTDVSTNFNAGSTHPIGFLDATAV
jgi:hypothetical protein